MICPPDTLIAYLKGQEPVLDLGCGPGDFLLYLKDGGLEASGLELDEQNVMIAKAKGLDAVQGDAFQVLPELKSRYGAIVLSHVIEHFDGENAAGLLKLCQGALKPSGRLLILTPNPRNLKVISSLFWEDPTHVRPYGPPALERLLRESGLGRIELHELQEPGKSALWSLRDSLRRALVGPFWGSQEILAVAEKGN